MNKFEYLKDPTSCPYCGSSHIASGVIDSSHIAEVACDSCSREWVEIYTPDGKLIDVLATDEIVAPEFSRYDLKVQFN